MNRKIKYFLALLLVLNGCITVKLHENLTDVSKISTVSEQAAWYLFFYRSTNIKKIDQKKIPNVFAFSFELDPGKHQISAVLRILLFPPVSMVGADFICDSLFFESLANHEYKVQYSGFYNEDGTPQALWPPRASLPWIEMVDVKTRAVLDKKMCRGPLINSNGN